MCSVHDTERGESRSASGAGCAPRLTVGRSTGRPEGAVRQATKQATRRWQAIEQRIGEDPCESMSWSMCLAFQSHFRIIAWAACRLSLILRTNPECCFLLRPLVPKPLGPEITLNPA